MLFQVSNSGNNLQPPQPVIVVTPITQQAGGPYHTDGSESDLCLMG